MKLRWYSHLIASVHRRSTDDHLIDGSETPYNEERLLVKCSLIISSTGLFSYLLKLYLFVVNFF